GRAECMRSWLTQRSSRDARLVYRLPHMVASPKPALPSISVSKPSPVRRRSWPRSDLQLVGVGLPTLAVPVHHVPYEGSAPNLDLDARLASACTRKPWRRPARPNRIRPGLPIIAPLGLRLSARSLTSCGVSTVVGGHGFAAGKRSPPTSPCSPAR